MANEKRLIDANALKEAALNSTVSKTVKHAICILAEIAPIVDAVEVVRCKDCKHGVWDEGEQMFECTVSVGLTGDADTYAMFHEFNDGEHFCSYGERKANGRSTSAE